MPVFASRIPVRVITCLRASYVWTGVSLGTTAPCTLRRGVTFLAGRLGAGPGPGGGRVGRGRGPGPGTWQACGEGVVAPCGGRNILRAPAVNAGRAGAARRRGI